MAMEEYSFCILNCASRFGGGGSHQIEGGVETSDVNAGFSPKRGSAVMYRALTEKRRAFHRAALEQQRSWGAGPAVRARMLITQFYTCYALAFGMAVKSLISTYFKPSQGSTDLSHPGTSRQGGEAHDCDNELTQGHGSESGNRFCKES